MRHGIYRPGSLHHVYAGARGGKPSGWVHRLAVPSVLSHAAPKFMETMAPGLPGFMSDMVGGLFSGRLLDPDTKSLPHDS